jgi:hypothetical protein
MPQTTTATATRCDHDAARDACPWCQLETRDAGHVATRAARRLAASLRRAIRDAERERDTLRGYRLTAGTVSAHRATSPVLRAVTDNAETIGAAFYSDVAGETVERVARYIGRPTTSADVLAAYLTGDGAPWSYAARLARRVARSIASGTGTGRGSMPTFTVDRTDAERELIAIYRRAIRATGAAFTLADGHGHRRAMTDAERELVLDSLRPERAERAPLYAQWLTGLGDTLPDVRDGHGTGHVAPYVPERDAAPLRRGTVWQRLRAVGADVDTVRALRAIFDIVNRPDEAGRYRVTAPWQTVRDGLTIGVTSGTLQRRARRYARAVRERERRELIGQPFTVPDAERATPSTRLMPVATGHHIGRGVSDSSPVSFPIAPYRWQTVTGHLTDDTGTVLCVRGGRCADGCAALQLLPVATRDAEHTYLERPLWNGNGCGHVDGCPVDCPTRQARALRVARWDRITPATGTDTVRALLARNARERAHAGT